MVFSFHLEFKALVFSFHLEFKEFHLEFNSIWGSHLRKVLFIYFVAVLIVALLFLKICNCKNGEQKMDIYSFTSSWHLLWPIFSLFKENLSSVLRYITDSIICGLNAIWFSFQWRFKLYIFFFILFFNLTYWISYNFLFPFLRDHIFMHFSEDEKPFFLK